MDLSMWRGKSICFSAVITDCMFSRGNCGAESAVMVLLFSYCGRKIKESADI